MPALWLAVGLFLLLAWFMHSSISAPEWRDTGRSLFYVMNWGRAFRDWSPTALAHTWSLSIEEQFYLLWPLVIAAGFRSPASRNTQGITFLLAAVAVAVYREYAPYTSHRIYFGLDTHADGLLAGSALACFLSARDGRGMSPGWSRAFGYMFAPAAAVGIAACMAVWSWPESNSNSLGYVVYAGCSAVIIWDLAAGSRGPIRWLVSLRPLVWLGTISYGLYLYHYPIYHALQSVDVLWSWERRLAAGAVVTIAVAAASYYLIERRVLAVKSHFERRH